MGAFSSKPKKVEVTAVDRTILDLKNARDRLQRYRKKLEEDDAKLLQRAADAKQKGRKETALGLLRLRKFKQVQASNCEDQLLNVLKMLETIDSKQNEAALLAAMSAGKDTLKRMHEETTVDDVLKLMDEIQETHETEKEINDILQTVPHLSVADEEVVEAELAALEAEMNGAQVELPQVPTTKLPEIQTPVTNATTPAEPAGRVAVPG